MVASIRHYAIPLSVVMILNFWLSTKNYGGDPNLWAGFPTGKTILMSHHASSTLGINAINLRTADTLSIYKVGGLHSAVRKLVASISKVLLDDGNRIVNPEGIRPVQITAF